MRAVAGIGDAGELSLFTSNSVRRSPEERDHRSRLQPKRQGFSLIAQRAQNIFSTTLLFWITEDRPRGDQGF